MAEKFRAMADALVELYHGVNAAPQNVYDNDMETFAIFTKSAINLARQVGCSTALSKPYVGHHRSRWKPSVVMALGQPVSEDGETCQSLSLRT